VSYSGARPIVHSLNTATVQCEPYEICEIGYSQSPKSVPAAPLLDLGSQQPLTLKAIANGITTVVMIDSGASSQFVDVNFLNRHHLVPRQKRFPESLCLADGSETRQGKITHEIDLELHLGYHKETITFQVTHLGRFPLILGKSWLRQHNPLIDWRKNTVCLCSEFCKSSCLKDLPKGLPVNLSGAQSKEVDISALSFHELQTLSIELESPIYAIAVSDISDMSSENVPRARGLSHKHLKDIIPVQYHNLLKFFSKEEADKLPPHRYIDHTIDLLSGTRPKFGPMYSMSDIELAALRDYLDENLTKGFIRPSTSSCASPILFVKKPDGGL